MFCVASQLPISENKGERPKRWGKNKTQSWDWKQACLFCPEPWKYRLSQKEQLTAGGQSPEEGNYYFVFLLQLKSPGSEYEISRTSPRILSYFSNPFPEHIRKCEQKRKNPKLVNFQKGQAIRLPDCILMEPWSVHSILFCGWNLFFSKVDWYIFLYSDFPPSLVLPLCSLFIRLFSWISCQTDFMSTPQCGRKCCGARGSWTETLHWPLTGSVQLDRPLSLDMLVFLEVPLLPSEWPSPFLLVGGYLLANPFSMKYCWIFAQFRRLHDMMTWAGPLQILGETDRAGLVLQFTSCAKENTFILTGPHSFTHSLKGPDVAGGIVGRGDTAINKITELSKLMV